MSDSEEDQTALLTNLTLNRSEAGSDVEAEARAPTTGESALTSAAISEQDARNGHLKPDTRRLFLVLFSLSFAFGFLGLSLVTIWMAPGLNETGSDGKLDTASTLASLHPILMYVFMFSLNSYAALIYRTHFSCSKEVLKWTHAILGCINITCSLLGVAAMYIAHIKRGQANFYSLHSWIGASTNVLYLAQLLAGLSVFLNPKASFELRTRLIPLHRFAGALILVLASFAVTTGVSELAIFQGIKAYTSFERVTFIANLSGVSCILSTAISVYLLAQPQYLRPNKPNELTSLLRQLE